MTGLESSRTFTQRRALESNVYCLVMSPSVSIQQLGRLFRCSFGASGGIAETCFSPEQSEAIYYPAVVILKLSMQDWLHDKNVGHVIAMAVNHMFLLQHSSARQNGKNQ